MIGCGIVSLVQIRDDNLAIGGCDASSAKHHEQCQFLALQLCVHATAIAVSYDSKNSLLPS